MRLLTLNISGPSVERAEGLTDYLLNADIDLLVLTETRDNLGTQRLLSSLAENGYDSLAPIPPTASGQRWRMSSARSTTMSGSS